MKSFGSVLSFTRERNAALLKAYREEINAVVEAINNNTVALKELSIKLGGN